MTYLDVIGLSWKQIIKYVAVCSCSKNSEVTVGSCGAGLAEVDEVSLDIVVDCGILRQDPLDTEGSVTVSQGQDMLDLWNHSRGLLGVGLDSEPSGHLAEDIVIVDHRPNPEPVGVVLQQTGDLVGPDAGGDLSIQRVPVGLVPVPDLAQVSVLHLEEHHLLLGVGVVWHGPGHNDTILRQLGHIWRRGRHQFRGFASVPGPFPVNIIILSLFLLL